MGLATAEFALRPGDLGDEPLSQALSDEDESSTGASAGNDTVDDWGVQSFPASDPPQNW